MDSSISPKDEIWFLRVCHHISTGLYNSKRAQILFTPRWKLDVTHRSLIHCKSPRRWYWLTVWPSRNGLPIKPAHYAPHFRPDLPTRTSDVGEDGMVQLRFSLLGFGVVIVNRVFLCRFVELELKLNVNASLL